MRKIAEARERAGLTIEQAARKARISAAYLRKVERGGCDSFPLAERLSEILGCRIDLFLGLGGGGTPANTSGRCPNARRKLLPSHGGAGYLDGSAEPAARARTLQDTRK